MAASRYKDRQLALVQGSAAARQSFSAREGLAEQRQAGKLQL
jgi:hypothetical protein